MKIWNFYDEKLMVKHAQIITITSLLVQKIIRSTVRGVSSLRHDHGHKSHHTTLATLSRIKLQFKDHRLGTRLFGKCPTLRKLFRFPVLSNNNSTRAIIIPKNVIITEHDDGHLTPLTFVVWWSGGRHFDAWKCWWGYHLRPPPQTNVVAPHF